LKNTCISLERYLNRIFDISSAVSCALVNYNVANYLFISAKTFSTAENSGVCDGE
jgi:hypothetical protein